MSWLPKQRVVVPFDFSEVSCGAVKTALQLVDNPSHLDVIYVIRAPHPGEPAVLWGKQAERIARVRTALQDKLVENNFEGVNVHVREGSAGEQIVSLATELRADLIVMPSHGRHGLSRLLLGSVTERVLRFAHCPVLVLRRAPTSVDD